MAAPSGASAALLEFDDMGLIEPVPFMEDGYAVSPSDWGDLGSDGALHVEICCGPFGHGFELARPDGALFSVSSLEMTVLGDLVQEGDAKPDVHFTGYRDGMLVAEAFAASQDTPVMLFDDFTGLDLFRLESINNFEMDELLSGDAHFEVDNIAVSLTPIPLAPASAALGAGLGLMLLVRRRRFY